MPSENTKISEFNQYQKSYKARFNIDGDLECIEKTDRCKNNPENSYTGEYRGDVHSIRNSEYRVPKKSSRVFHNGSNYDYHFTIKVLAEYF